MMLIIVIGLLICQHSVIDMQKINVLNIIYMLDYFSDLRPTESSRFFLNLTFDRTVPR